MRSLHSMIAFAGIALAGLLLTACYSNGDLGAEPFRCNQVYPDCPTNYTCAFNLGLDGKIAHCQSKANCVCIMQCSTDNDCPLSLPQGTCKPVGKTGVNICTDANTL